MKGIGDILAQLVLIAIFVFFVLDRVMAFLESRAPKGLLPGERINRPWEQLAELGRRQAAHE